MTDTNYSIESLKKSAFSHELKNNFEYDQTLTEDERLVIQSYFDKRLKEIDTGLNER
jgi:hypothetical protein